VFFYQLFWSKIIRILALDTKTGNTMIYTLKNTKVEVLNATISKWHGKRILKTNVTDIVLDQFENICSIKDETSYKPNSQEAFPSSESFHIYSPKIEENSFNYKTDKSKTESEKISGLWLDPQGDFMVTLPDPLMVEMDDDPYSEVGEKRWVRSSGMLIFRSEKIDFEGINRKLAQTSRS
jgi:hypothetical protein